MTYRITEVRTYGTVLLMHDRGQGHTTQYEVPVELLPPRTRVEVGAIVTPWVPVVVAHRVSYSNKTCSLHHHRDLAEAATTHRPAGVTATVADLAELPHPVAPTRGGDA